MPGIKSNSIRFPFLTCFFNVLKLCALLMSQLWSAWHLPQWLWEVARQTNLFFLEMNSQTWTYAITLKLFGIYGLKKKHIWKQAQVTQTWSQFTYLGDNCILLKKIRFNISAKHKGQSGPSSVFIVTVPVLPAMFPKQDVCCVWWRKRQSTVQMGTLGFWVSVQTIRSGITERINRELYTVDFMVLLFRTYFKYIARCQMSANQWAPPASDGAALTFETWNKAVDLWQ